MVKFYQKTTSQTWILSSCRQAGLGFRPFHIPSLYIPLFATGFEGCSVYKDQICHQLAECVEIKNGTAATCVCPEGTIGDGQRTIPESGIKHTGCFKRKLKIWVLKQEYARSRHLFAPETFQYYTNICRWDRQAIFSVFCICQKLKRPLHGESPSFAQLYNCTKMH